jgi:nicotinamide riboside transporter PnuC
MTLVLDVVGVALLVVMTGALYLVHPLLALAAAAGLFGVLCVVLAARRDVSRETQASE